MAVAFIRGTTTGSSDLTITVRNSSNTLIDPYRIEYAVYDYTTGIEILMGSPVNIPTQISTGNYYAPVTIPADAKIGVWRIRWTVQEYSTDPVYQSVQEFQVLGDTTIPSFTGDVNTDKLIYSLRIMLRDNNPDRNYSVAGNERVDIRIGRKKYNVSLEELWKVIEDGRTNHNDYKEIYEGFKNEKLEVLSVSRNKKVEWKKILDATRHNVLNKSQFVISTNDGRTCHATGDHSLFTEKNNEIMEQKTGDFKINSDIVCVEEGEVILRKVFNNILAPLIEYMYDLSVEDNHNFVLESGILAHNTFRPPASEKFIQGQTQVFGFIWEDEELLEYIYMAIDDFNSRPPTSDIGLSNLSSSERRWRTTVILRAAAFACFAIAMNWIANEFSLDSKEMITVKDKNGDIYSLTVRELFDLMYGDRLKEITDQAKKEVMESIEELKNE